MMDVSSPFSLTLEGSSNIETLALSLLMDGYIGAFGSLISQCKDPTPSLLESSRLHQAKALLVELETQALQEQPLFTATRALALFYMDFAPEIAVPFALRALDLARDDEEKALSHLTLGDVWGHLGNLETVFSHYFEALPNPEALTKWVATALQLGQAHEKRGEWVEAVQLYKNTLLKSSDSLVLLRLGLAELALGNLEDAKIHLETFISNVDVSSLEPGPAYIALAQTYEKSQNYDKAIECLSSYLSRSTSTISKTQAAVKLSQLLNRLGRWDEAQRVLHGIDLTDEACIHLGIARGHQHWKDYLTHLQSSPQLVLEFLHQLENKQV